MIGKWTLFKPQSNMAPLHKKQGVNQLELSVKSIKTNIDIGYRGSVPSKWVWMYLSPFLAPSWWALMKSKQRKKNAEDAAKQAEIDVGKHSIIKTFNGSDTEENSLKKSDIHSARQANDTVQ